MSPNNALPRALLFLFALATLLISSCAGTGVVMAEEDYPEMRVSFRDFRGAGANLELVNSAYAQSHSATEGADVRTQTGEVLDALINLLGDEGFWDYARPGNGPLAPQAEGGETMHSAMEVLRGGQHGWITFRRGLTKEELTFFSENSKVFLAIFNQTSGFHKIENTEGANIFRRQ
jgi:hypothetical protein